MTSPSPNSENDLGPFMKGIGVLLTAGGVAMSLMLVLQDRVFTWIHFAVVSLLLVAGLIVWRPKMIELILQTVADKLPFVKFTKEDK